MAGKSRKLYPYEPDYVVHPGATLAEWFAWSHVTHSVAWKLYGLADEDQLQGIIDGKVEISKEIAEKLAAMTHIPANLWLALEHNFRVGLAAGLSWEHDDGAG